MTREELSRVNRNKANNTNKKARGSGKMVFLYIILLINVVAIAVLFYMAIDSRATSDKQEKQIAGIEKQLSKINQTAAEKAEAPATKTEETTGDQEQQGTATSDNGREGKTNKTHVVEVGETLSTISTVENVSLDDLRSLNGLTDDVLNVGQKLILE